MKRSSFKVAVVLGLIAVYIEFISIKGWTIDLIGGFFDLIPFSLLSVLFFVFAYKDFTLYKSNNKITSYLPTLTCLGFIMVVAGQMYLTAQRMKSKPLFTAYNYQITDEGFNLEFLKNGYVKGLLARRFSVDYFCGKYEIVGDTVHLKMRNNIGLGSVGVLYNDSLQMVDDSIYFLVDFHHRR